MDQSSIVHRQVELAPLSGREEELLVQRKEMAIASLVTTILGCCIRRIGSVNPVSQEVVRNLLAADRQYLLLKLRQVTFGDRVQATILCPWPNCGKKFDIDFSLESIPIRESEDKGPIYMMELSPEAALRSDLEENNREITFRLPTGGDQELISPFVFENEARALTMLLERCLQSIGPVKNPGEELISRLSPLARMEIERQMEAAAPKVDLTMEANCPECDRAFPIPFDLQGFFFGELRTSIDLLYREVHYLAYHYHWSERDIMEMPREKRRKYIEVLADEIERLNNEI